MYTDMQVRPPDAYFAAYPQEVTAPDMRPHFDAVKQMLGASPSPSRPPRHEAFAKAVAMAGLGQPESPDLALEFSDFADTPAGAHNNGGNRPPGPDGASSFARSTLDRTYLPLAMKCGAELRPLSEVTAIGPHDGAWQIRYRDHTTHRTYIESTARLVLAAGTLGSLRLLFASRDKHGTLPRLGRALGSRFNPNGDMATLLVGIPALRGLRPEPTVSAVLHRSVAEHTAITGAFGFPLNQFRVPKPLAPVVRRSTILFGMGSGTMSAQVSFDGDELHIAEGRDDDTHIYSELEDDASRLARGYEAKRRFINVPFGARSDRLFTVFAAAKCEPPTVRPRRNR